VRALPDDGEPSDLALTELARGLASWAGWFMALPGRADLRGPLTLDKAVDGLPRPAERWSPIEAGMFTRLDGLEGFTPAVDALGPPEADPEALSDLEPTTTGGSSPTDDEPPVLLPAPAEMAARAAEHGDPHVVKFTEACIRENALRPDPVYLLAAQHVLDRTPALSGSGPA